MAPHVDRKISVSELLGAICTSKVVKACSLRPSFTMHILEKKKMERKKCWGHLGGTVAASQEQGQFPPHTQKGNSSVMDITDSSQSTSTLIL